MKLSARNQLKGIIREIKEGPINSEVSIEVKPDVLIYAQISTASVRRLELAVGKEASAIFKIDSVMIGVDD
jgi:molybdate transport system regulatory protein